MKFRFKFFLFFALSLLSFIFYMGLFFILILIILLPLLGIPEAQQTDIHFLFAFLGSIVSGSFLFSYFFVKPLLNILDLIKKLSSDTPITEQVSNYLSKSTNKLKLRYILYSEVILNLSDLSNKLLQAKEERKELEEAKKLWIRGVSHDLKTPLSYVIGYSTLLTNNDYTWAKEEQNHFLQLILNKSLYMEDLIKDFNLSFQLSENNTIPLKKANYNLALSLQNLIADICNNPKAFDYEFSFHASNNDFPIYADEKLLNRAFENLLINSVVHNAPGTKIGITLSSNTENTVTVSISDNGSGNKNIPQSESMDNWGMGLTIVKNIINLHGGTFIHDTSLTTGSCYVIELPAT